MAIITKNSYKGEATQKAIRDALLGLRICSLNIRLLKVGGDSADFCVTLADGKGDTLNYLIQVLKVEVGSTVTITEFSEALTFRVL